MSDITEELVTSLRDTPYARFLGLELVDLAEGYAKVSVALRPEYANFLGGTHAGLIMSLAAYAFGCACNTLGQIRVAVQFNVNFVSTPELKGVLTAVARTVHAGKTTSLTEVAVTDATGRVVAKATGTTVTKLGRSVASGQ